MKLLILVLILISCILGCKKTIDIDSSSESFPGALDSCVLYISPNSFSSDSGVYSGNEQQIYKFGYDAQHRVTKMTGVKLGINISDLSFLFYYNGTSTNPYLIKDSTFSGTYYSVSKHHLTYDNLDRVVLDSFVRYNYNTNGTINSSSIWVDIRRHDYVSNFMSSSSSQFTLYNTRDTIYFNSNGDEMKKIFNSYYSTYGYNYSLFEYHPVENPFYRLNIRKALFGIVGFYWASLPSSSIDLVQPRYLFKKVAGFYYNGTYSWDKYSAYSNCYYETTSSGLVNKIVMISYESVYNTSNWYRSDVASIRFFYH